MAVSNDILNWCNEQSQMFDALYNNTASNQAPKLDDYEKSLFLTKAQDEIIKNHFTAVSNPKGQGFDSNFKRQSEFATLIKTGYASCIEGDSTTDKIDKIDQRSILYLFPKDYFLTINEMLYENITENETSETDDQDDQNETDNQSTDETILTTLYQYVVNPIQYGEYKRLMLKPYQYPVKKTAWRLFTGTITITDNSTTNNNENSNSENSNSIEPGTYLVAEIIGNFHTDTPTYQLRYVKHPNPIILTDLTKGDYYGLGLTINGKTQPSICELGADAFNEVMQRAVELAKNSWEGTVETTKTFGERSE